MTVLRAQDLPSGAVITQFSVRSRAMPTSAVLDELIDALEIQSDSLFVFLDRETGEVEEISEESLSLTRLSRRIDLLPDWQKEEAERAVRI